MPSARVGDVLRIRNHQVEFSNWPMRRADRRWGLGSMIYAGDAWAVIVGALDKCNARDRATAMSFVNQAREYYSAAASAATIETKPVLYYYSFLNLGKALGLARRQDGLVGRVTHGVSHPHVDGETITQARLKFSRSTAAHTSAFDEFRKAVAGSSLSVTECAVSELMAQVLVGHRLWLDAANRRQRFFAIEQIRFIEDPASKLLWLQLDLDHGNLQKAGRSLSETLNESELAAQWRHVAGPRSAIHRLEMTVPVRYSHRSSDVVVEVVGRIKPYLWRTMASAMPYRRYYLYLSPGSETRLPQLVTTYAFMFYLGTLTRYYPTELIAILAGPYGAFCREFLESVPPQMLYEIACEFREQEVTKAGVL